ncbi:dolichol kinase EVAN isoform X2 [Nicotiana tomentosiformis]|uniref:dolichol kinase EVAN isoform X2 n=1 Tax=Nicotiana tomentosiformis TaxID=4098 RepID=UPI00051B579F|nr:dolichol kinase EVAN isoform X2 [Nicotiana tomentosiformis]
MASSPSFLTGERAVVALFIGQIVFSISQSLLSESLSLSLLSLLALSVEISVDASSSVSLSHFFKTRPGASSGIFLGAVTLPGLMVSKLIQISRAVSLNQVGTEELENLQLLYWVTSASCFTVLAYLCFIFYRQSDSKNCATFRVSLSCIALYFGVCCVSFAVKSHGGWYAVANLLWLFFHGFAAVKLIQNILHTFPACASIGEALLVTVGLVIYFSDMLACTAAKSHGYFTASKLVMVPYGVKRSEVSIIIQGLITGLLIFPMLFKNVLQILERVSSAPSRDRGDDQMRRSLVFYVSLVFVLVIAVPSWMQLVQDFHVHPFLWVLDFVLSEPLKRLSLCIYWLVVIYVSVIRFYNISKSSKIERILLRKYYHLMAVLMFVPALILQPKFLDLAFGAALAVFLILETIRIWRIWPLGHLVHQFMNAFTDHRDTDLLIVSHFSLLLGCALPIWLSSGFNDRPLAPFAGILSLGIGDTMASVVGYKYGVLRWSKTGKKTIEGTAAGITSVLAACSILLPLLATSRYILDQNWFSLLFAVTISGLLEAYTAQLDNAFIPLVFYSLLCL